jgi:TRAP-type C4-dicarboxylate transport system permease small subunit
VTRWIDRYCRLLDALIALALAVMVVLVFGNVVLRYAFNSGITVSEELSRWLFLWVTFLGAVVALKDHAHLGTDLVVARLPRALRRVCLVVAQALMLWATALLLQGSLAQTRINWDVEAPVSGLSVGWFYGAGVAFAVPALVLLAVDLWRALTGRSTDAHAGVEH